MDVNEVHRRWAERSRAYSPDYYAYYGPNETSDLLLELLARFVERDAAVLEVGCSSGRHLAHLYEHGYQNVTGIDVNDDAFDVMERTYPDLATGGTFHHGTLENTVPSFDDDHFDVAYSVETLQHIHPDNDWVFDEIDRVTEEVCITAEVEPDDDSRDRGPDGESVSDVDGIPLYYRNWNRVFTDLGFVERFSTELDRLTVRAFRATGR